MIGAAVDDPFATNFAAHFDRLTYSTDSQIPAVVASLRKHCKAGRSADSTSRLERACRLD
jgi:hypothetical protein